MIYTRVYETKILKLADGRIIHFSLQGRNNDNIGTNRNTFTAKICTMEEYKNNAQAFMNDPDPNIYIEIKSKKSSRRDYGKYLIRMLRHAYTYERFIKKWNIMETHVKSIIMYDPQKEIFEDPSKFDIRDWIFHTGTVSYKPNYEYIKICSEQDLIDKINSNRNIQIYIGKDRKNIPY